MTTKPYRLSTDAERTEMKTIIARNIETAISKGKEIFAHQANDNKLVHLIIRDTNDIELDRVPLR